MFKSLMVALVLCFGCGLDNANRAAPQSPSPPNLIVGIPKVQKDLDDFRLAMRSTSNLANVGMESGRIFDLRDAAHLSHKQWIEQLFLQTLPAKEPDGVGAWAAQVYFVKMNHLFDPTIGPRDYLDALATSVESADSDISQRALGMIDVCDALSRRPTGAAGDFITEFDQMRDFLPTNDGGLTHVRLITHLYETDANAALATMCRTYAKDAHARQKLLGQLMQFQVLRTKLGLAEVTAPVEPVVSPHEMSQELHANLQELAASDSWCMRAYAAAMVPELKIEIDASVLKRLRDDNHPVVVQLMKNTRSFSTTRPAPVTRPSNSP